MAARFSRFCFVGGGEPSDGLPTESRRYGRLENLRYDPGKPEKSEMRIRVQKDGRSEDAAPAIMTVKLLWSRWRLDCFGLLLREQLCQRGLTGTAAASVATAHFTMSGRLSLWLLNSGAYMHWIWATPV